MKILAQTSIYLENGETLQKVIEITTDDLEKIAKEKALDKYGGLSVTVKTLEVLNIMELQE